MSWLWLKLAGGFVKAQWKWLVIGLIAVVVLFLAFKVYRAFIERDALLEERKGTISGLVQDRTILETEVASKAKALAELAADKERLQRNYDALALELSDIRKEIRAQKKIFQDHDFAKLANAKPGLIEKIVNKGTQEKWDALAAAADD